MRVSEWPTWPCAIEVDGLVKSYGSVRAADGVTFQVTAGEIFGLLGANGAGKTTVLGVLEGVRRSDEGRVRVLGWDVADMPHRSSATSASSSRRSDSSRS